MSGSRASKIDTICRTDKHKIYVMVQQSTCNSETSCIFLSVELSGEECSPAKGREDGRSLEQCCH